MPILECSSGLCHCQYLKVEKNRVPAECSYEFGEGGDICLQLLSPFHCVAENLEAIAILPST